MHTPIHVTINGKTFELPNPVVSGAAIKELASIPLSDTLLLDHHGTEKVVENDETVTLHEGADLHSRPPHHIAIFINRKRYVLDNHTQTGASLKALAGIPPTDTLFLQRHGEDQVIGNETTITLHNGAHLHSQPPCDYGRTGPITAEDLGMRNAFQVLPQPDGWTYVVVDDYALPSAYVPCTTRLLVKLPPTFPDARPDMFWLNPGVRTAAGGEPAGTSGEQMLGAVWQRFSWHLKEGAWQPGVSTLRDFMRCIRARFERGN
jgi:hypothetical protein